MSSIYEKCSAQLEFAISAYAELQKINPNSSLLRLVKVGRESFIVGEPFRRRYQCNDQDMESRLAALMSYESDLSRAIELGRMVRAARVF